MGVAIASIAFAVILLVVDRSDSDRYTFDAGANQDESINWIDDPY